MKKSEAKMIAKEKLMEAIATAYYRLEDDGFDEDEQEAIVGYINVLGARMAKAIGEEYYTL